MITFGEILPKKIEELHVCPTIFLFHVLSKKHFIEGVSKKWFTHEAIRMV
jgi:hypothetical protein